jgi:hypothetical protein
MAALDPLQPIVILAGTVSLIAASGTRHTALSDRMRSLAADYRKLPITKPEDSDHAKQLARRSSLVHQICIFRRRCSFSVWAHRALYLALVVEVAAFGTYFFNNLADENYKVPFSAVFVLVGAGVLLHLYEHCWANQTVALELQDIPEEKIQMFYRNPQTPPPPPKPNVRA